MEQLLGFLRSTRSYKYLIYSIDRIERESVRELPGRAIVQKKWYGYKSHNINKYLLAYL